MARKLMPRYPALTDYIAAAAMLAALAILSLCALAEVIIIYH